MAKGNDILKRIKEIINERCVNHGDRLISYKNFYWVSKDGENHADGFKRVYFNEYVNEFDEIFDEIHAY